MVHCFFLDWSKEISKLVDHSLENPIWTAYWIASSRYIAIAVFSGEIPSVKNDGFCFMWLFVSDLCFWCITCVSCCKEILEGFER